MDRAERPPASSAIFLVVVAATPSRVITRSAAWTSSSLVARWGRFRRLIAAGRSADSEDSAVDVFDGSQTFGSADCPDVDVDTARDVLAQVERLAVNELAESVSESDRNPPVFDPATSTAPLPESFKRSCKAYMDTEFWRLWFAGNVLPHLAATRAVVEATDLSLMDLDEAAF